ncbi:hypothetical protein Vretimale_16500 [Volvox reticuliferus]|uniref:CS domain-containing protein n=1 Tax=Volvox reticuliferus TaxID=1737510 RepID=A0A8J4GU98_9CHLO|nr:hypothetical protein Vretifemale_17573 [Volvox reticuliferus]GIM13448.1 hypothetical protein Vretimale_16500 [Volvox reticuliferus]
MTDTVVSIQLNGCPHSPWIKVRVAFTQDVALTSGKALHWFPYVASELPIMTRVNLLIRQAVILERMGWIPPPQASIASKREQSYYYAHAPRETFEPPAPLPVPVVLERSTAEAPPAIVTIFNYAWADEGELVKVYIPLEGVGAKCSDDDIKVAFEVRLFQVEVHGFKPRQIHRLLIQKLSGDIAPGDCQVKKLANKVVVILKKAGSHRKWYSLRHNV